MKRLLILLICFVSILTGCSTNSKANVKVTEENVDYLVKYDESLQGYITEMTDILLNYNNALDGLYTNSTSNSQFAKIMTESIGKSNELVTKVEALDIEPDLFETHQTLIALVNRSHQLLLTSVDAANKADETTIDKDSLRQEYLAIKQEQANIANQWKILREELAAQANKEVQQ